MTTPEGPGSPADGPPAWGRPPAGGWGDPSGGRADPAAGDPAAGDPAAGERVAGGRVDPGAETRAWGPPPPVDHPGRPPAAPAWAQQPPPGGGWNPGPPGPHRIPPPPDAWGPPPGAPLRTPWGPPPGGPGYPPLPRPGDHAPRRSRTPFVVAGVVVALLALGAVLAFVAPGFLRSTVFDQAALQDGVRRVLLEDYRYDQVEGVACGAPGEQIAVRVDAAFACTATVDGAPVTVPVRVTSADGTYEVDRPR